MAYKDSGEIANNSNYALGDYSFRIERSSVPGSTNDKIEAICTDKDGKNARKSIQVPSNQNLSGWYVEANDTEATVYSVIQVPIGSKKSSSLVVPNIVPTATSCVLVDEQKEGGNLIRYESIITAPVLTLLYRNNIVSCLTAGTSQESTPYIDNIYVNGVLVRTNTRYIDRNVTVTHDGKTAYWNPSTISGSTNLSSGPVYHMISGSVADVAWTMIYGESFGEEYEKKEIMVGRFAIELEDAGGVGPGSDWTDPGDYDPDWEPDDPTHTLYVEVTGALSGRHNDPIEDPSYSYIPADKDTVKGYGCGGDGGHGGGGGAGASTVVVHKFATNQANSKEVTAIARRHGYGSGGGKGGKGGDGCILVYY